MRRDGIFIAVEVEDSAASDAALAAKLAEVCPVDIFAASDGRVEIVESNLDECVLCRLCLDAAGGSGSEQPVKVFKLYDDGAPLA
jgi:NAD-dependent dihydropyrimidine dehydrogenase PreA subunit